MTDEQFHQRAMDFIAQNGVGYREALRAVELIDRYGAAAERASSSFAEGTLASEEEFVAYAEVQAIKRRITPQQALLDAHAEVTHAEGARHFYDVVRHGVQPSDADMNDAARVLVAQTGVSYSEALTHLATVVEFGDASKAIEVAFSEGKAVTDDMVHAAAMMHSTRTGMRYPDALVHVMNTLPVPVGAQFAEAAAAIDPQQGVELEIFRAGTHIDNAGGKRTFTVDDVRAMATSYDPSMREAPMVKGHPDDTAPAYGWIASLRATDDGRLIARATQWDEGFLKDLKDGRYKKRSASFYPPDHSSNPKPGTWYLRHLGWLGAQQPAVAGLADAAFQAPTNDMVTFAMPMGG